MGFLSRLKLAQAAPSVLLSDLTGDVVWLVCDKCGRKGRYRVAGLIEKYGADKKLTYLCTEIADCPKAYTEGSKNIYDLCGVRWRLAYES